MQRWTPELENLCVNTIRTLAIDAVQKANSGHPGMPMGMADAAFVLWVKFLRHNPRNPQWVNRDRFILSAGHGSMLLYSLLHLTGYDLPLEELKRFRQWESKTPGHPEYGLTPGVETTTGPLGQGFANGVGMALAERLLATRFNRPGFDIVDHYTYAIVSDGDLMEGISHEAAALAGHLRLGKIIYLYDDNGISIDGPTSLAYSDDVAKRFEAYHWHVQRVDGHDRKAVEEAIRAAQEETERPSLIMCRTHIAYGSPNKQDTAASHGAPLGEEEVKLTKRNLGWPEDAEFYIPEEALAVFRQAVDEGAQREQAWNELFARYKAEHPDLAAEFERVMAGELPEGWDADLPAFSAGDPDIATRAASGAALNALVPAIPELIGGSADLTPSNNTRAKGMQEVKPGDFSGRYIHFGVREHGMGSLLNGIALHGGLIPYGGTFMVFSDYMRPPVRLAAMMGIRVIFIFTHDSIFVGEDGPTHQPVEHLAALRSIPNLVVIRPADANETVEAWKVALTRSGPTALALTRQKLPILDRSQLAPATELRKGGYTLVDAPNGQPDVILIATGSEVALALQARDLLAADGIQARVVNLPSWELFEEQPQSYRDEVLPPDITRRVGVEAAVRLGWDRYIGPEGIFIGLDRFGASAPYKILAEKLGFTPERVAEAARSLMR
ncbi:MAG: transketolase [Chloroflexi bacterium]|nr:transketolase [Chloroflexota bacterium]